MTETNQQSMKEHVDSIVVDQIPPEKYNLSGDSDVVTIQLHDDDNTENIAKHLTSAGFNISVSQQFEVPPKITVKQADWHTPEQTQEDTTSNNTHPTCDSENETADKSFDNISETDIPQISMHEDQQRLFIPPEINSEAANTTERNYIVSVGDIIEIYPDNITMFVTACLSEKVIGYGLTGENCLTNENRYAIYSKRELTYILFTENGKLYQPTIQ